METALYAKWSITVVFTLLRSSRQGTKKKRIVIYALGYISLTAFESIVESSPHIKECTMNLIRDRWKCDGKHCRACRGVRVVCWIGFLGDRVVRCDFVGMCCRFLVFEAVLMVHELLYVDFLNIVLNLYVFFNRILIIYECYFWKSVVCVFDRRILILFIVW